MPGLELDGTVLRSEQKVAARLRNHFIIVPLKCQPAFRRRSNLFIAIPRLLIRYKRLLQSRIPCRRRVDQ